MTRLAHPFEPVWTIDARVLVLGTFPSEGSVRAGGYYGHPTNQFWKLMGDVLGQPVLGRPEHTSDIIRLTWLRRYELLKEHGIALWDVVKECDRDGASSDSKLTNVVPNDIPELVLLKAPSVRRIVFTGTTAERLFRQHLSRPDMAWCPELMTVPSPSAANPMRYADKLDAYRAALAPKGSREAAPYTGRGER